MGAKNENVGNERVGAPLFGSWAQGLLAVLAVLFLVGVFLAVRTNDAMSEMPFLQQHGKAGQLVERQKTLVDETPWSTAQSLAAVAVSQEELSFAREAERMADHDVDQAFATALRKANLQQQKALTGEALEAQQHVTEMEATVVSDQQVVKDATPKGGDDLEIAQAQLGLDTDELADAKEDLARASGDQRGEIQQELTTRQAEMKKFEADGGLGETAVIAVGRYRTLAGLIGAWQRQNQRLVLLQQAKAATEADATHHVQEHNALESVVKTGVNASDTAGRIAGLKRMSLERQLMSIYDDRVDTEKQLAGVYDKWEAQVTLQHRIVQHLMLVQCLWIVVILIVSILLNAAVRHFTEGETLDQRRMRTLNRILRLLVQALTLLSLLLVIFGPPDHLSTAVGLVTAGLTVALQDFILAFVGWFILMGRAGIGVGDVVEIDGVTGEVVEIGLFRTTLLETGNWTANGHPTGRRVAFNNKFAISGKFFNFSTSGQWMWDELTVSVPEDKEIGATASRVQAAVEATTSKDAAQAEAEWKRTSGSGLGQFSAEPAVSLRPSGASVELVVRYVTRASVRVEQRDKLYTAVREALQR